MLINPFFFVTETSFIIVGIGSEADGGSLLFNTVSTIIGIGGEADGGIAIFSIEKNDYLEYIMFGVTNDISSNLFEGL